MFGEMQITEINKATVSGWHAYKAFVEKVVKQQVQLSKNRTSEGEPTCLIDIMLTDDIYKNNFDTLVCDLIVCKLGGTDTSRNTTLTALSHLAKNAKSREKVRNEIS